MNLYRKPGTKTDGNGWNRLELLAVWAKGRPVLGRDPNAFRKDACDKLIAFSEYGNRSSHLGWEVDHIFPVAHGGGDQLGNLQPLYWMNNVSKGDSLILKCAVSD